ncbi:carbohydrate-binding module family 18 protein [Piromyces sp. E2]|nr:carbohydrate-binding module family 18 protein [Piromyces sp. E2]|eukprot:OUM59380.1 carbohydrate-binding module family 18 protein [Piromyces sp. E2]
MKFINFIVGAFALISTVSAASIYSSDRCGPEYGNCESGYCCSKYNWCGKSDDHCSISKGCQSEFGKCTGGSTKTKTAIPTVTNVPSVNYKVDWAGFRFSPGGVEKNYGEIPNGSKWVGFVNKIAKHFKGAKPSVVVIVSENSKNTKTRFGFKKPSGVSDSSNIIYSSKDKFEEILDAFDDAGFHVWLQVEPGDNDLVALAKIVFKQYGHHSCVKGFGIDLEWWYRGSDGKGKKLSDSKAEAIVNYVRSINKNYTVFAKHWETEYMPPTYRDHMIFVDDCQDFKGKMDRMTKTFTKWAKAFPDNPVMFQIGYEKDKNLWNDKYSPIEVANTVVDSASQYNDQIGVLWVDFTMKKALELM